MRVKRYVVDSMPDALQKIRTDLGKDAVILSTKEIRSGGFMGMFSKKKIEVLAATDSTAAASSTKTASSPTPAVLQEQAPKSYNSLQTAQMAYSRPNNSAGAVLPKRNMDEPALSFPEVPDVLIPSPPPVAVKVQNHMPQAQQAQYVPQVQQTQQAQYVPQTQQVQNAQQAPLASATVAVNSKEDILLQELKQMKEFMHKLSVQGFQQSPMDPSLATLQQRMLDQELDPVLVQQVITEVTEIVNAEGMTLTDELAMKLIRKQLLGLFMVGESKHMAPDTRIVHFVGPTGVGKTTTIAKLAAEQVLKYNRKVGFITSDTYRIAAIEQLKTYATILNVPLEVVFSPQDLSKAYEQLKDCDLIFMDTAGRNYRNEMYVSELNSLLRSQGKSETFLVLSLTTKYKDMKAITDNFTKFKLDKVLFTKMDETDSFGSVVNLVHDFKLQLSYVTNGQSVPDDITELAEQHIIDLILGASNNE
ncbi:flagellar biosynthesis protein FlhF [Paenibacillus radicis (ex Xue et al. 2023)]|uniref:Flagellar biosynthesis protein FlhF n=1 Tax=Paenibacillus radicis (ex Xue et al. 2023) TaxID=2972489 RepID=A0ABT1YFR7_9BACL|nr:flagellar biosynthesis protein FlhF [Paenibacillus radicis (ex Xue et al. 2023)]MCR8630795.1 flagellar biosynthesis protein FlhF [Paenibacillus radicis (ex Xue et al. 2023)]